MNVCNLAVAMPQCCCHVLMTVVGCAALSDGYIAVKRDFPGGTIRSKSSLFKCVTFAANEREDL